MFKEDTCILANLFYQQNIQYNYDHFTHKFCIIFNNHSKLFLKFRIFHLDTYIKEDRFYQVSNPHNCPYHLCRLHIRVNILSVVIFEIYFNNHLSLKYHSTRYYNRIMEQVFFTYLNRKCIQLDFQCIIYKLDHILIFKKKTFLHQQIYVCPSSKYPREHGQSKISSFSSRLVPSVKH